MHQFGSYLPLFIIFALAMFIPLILKRIKKVAIPIVVGEIIAGMIVGESGFGLIGAGDTSINFFADMGFAVLMFLSGLEVDLSLLIRAKDAPKVAIYKNPPFVAVTIFLLTLLLAVGSAFILNMTGMNSDPIMMGLLLSTTSLGVVVPILKEKQLLNGNYGQTLLISALAADVLSMLLITIYISWRSTGKIAQMLLIVLIFVAFALFILIGKKLINHPHIQALKDGTCQILVRISFFLLLTFALLAEILGVEIILGAFLAGLIMSILTNDATTRIHDKMDSIGYGFFIPIFFIHIGATFDVRSVLENPKAYILILAFLIIAFVIKIIPALLLRFQCSLRDSIAAGTILSARLSLIIAAAAIGQQMGLITELTNGAILLVAILTCTLAPLLFSKIYKEEATKPKA